MLTLLLLYVFKFELLEFILILWLLLETDKFFFEFRLIEGESSGDSSSSILLIINNFMYQVWEVWYQK